MSSTPSDEQLLRGTLQGQRDDFGALTQRYYRLVYGIAFSYTGNATDAEDLSQESFLKAYRSLDTLRDISRFSAWLTRIVRNECHNWRSRRRQEASLADTARLDQNAVVSDVERNELFELLWREIDELDESSREILTVYYFHGKNTREVALRLAISVSAAEKRLQRARQSLGERLASRLDDALVPHQPDSIGAKRVSQAVVAIPVAWDSTKVALMLGAGKAASCTVPNSIVWVVLTFVVATSSVMLYTVLIENRASGLRSSAISSTAKTWPEGRDQMVANIQSGTEDDSAETASAASRSTGKPEFTVRVMEEGSGNRPLQGAEVIVIPLGHESITKATDESGLARFSRMPLGDLGVLVSHQDHVKRSFTHILLARGATLDVVLAKGTSIAGQVLDASSGEPLTAFGLELLGATPPWRDGPVPFHSHDGRFSITNTVDALSIAASAPGYSRIAFDLSSAPDWRQIELKLVRPLTIEGRVSDGQGRVIPGATIGIASRNLNRYEKHELVTVTQSDSDGEFTIEHADARYPWLVVANEGFVTHREQITSEHPPGTRVWHDIRLVRSAMVRGTVRYNGIPCGDAEIDAGPACPEVARTNAAGQFTLYPIDPGVTTIVATLANTVGDNPKAPSVGQLVELEDGQEAGVNFDFEARNSAITGSVHWAGGPTPDHDMYISTVLQGRAGVERHFAKVNLDEIFLFEGIPPGRAMLCVEVRVHGGVSHYRTAEVDVPAGKEIVQNFSIAPTASIEGRVQGVPDRYYASVQLLNVETAPEGSAFEAVYSGSRDINADGAFSFHPVDSGLYTLVATARPIGSNGLRGTMGAGAIIDRPSRSRWFNLSSQFEPGIPRLYDLSWYPNCTAVLVEVADGEAKEVDIRISP